MKKFLMMALILPLAFVARAENDALWLYWTVDSTESGIEFYGANLYVVEDGGTEGRLVSTKYADGKTTKLSGANELERGDQACGECLMSDISGIGIGAAFYVELLGATQETVGYWVGEYMSMEALTTAHEALTGMVAGLQTKEPFHHVHGGEWGANQFSTVPEPSGGILVLLGTALIMLRRRKLA